MPAFAIMDRDNQVLYQRQGANERAVVAQAVEEGVDLQHANLRGVNVEGLDLSKANIATAEQERLQREVDERRQAIARDNRQEPERYHITLAERGMER